MTIHITVEDLEAAAREVLPQGTYDYFAGGSEEEATLQANRAAYGRWLFRYRVLSSGGAPDPSLEIFGSSISMPVLMAPTAAQRLAHPDGEVASARAASRAGTVFCLSTLASRSIEEVAVAASGAKWFQLYVYADRGLTTELVDRAVAAGYRAILLTVDTPVLGRRERDLRNAFALPPGVTYANHVGPAAATGQVTVGESGLASYVAGLLDPGLTWRDLDWLVSKSPVPVLVKGIARGDDARRSLEHGAAGVIVSNHGGRQLDQSVATLDALADVVSEIGSEAPILLDGGIRRGTDVLKALCLGARAVLIGRPYLWALATGGQAGVEELLARLYTEVATSMTLLGVSSLAELSPDLLSPAPA